MILFLDEERAYVNWVSHHRTGFVLDCLRHPTKAHLVIHRATCPHIKQAASKRTHWTTGRRMKGCSLDLEELKRWANEAISADAACCPKCRPGQDDSTEHNAEHHLTRLDREILSTVLDIAACYLDDEDHPYDLTVGIVAKCLDKTPPQLTASLARLVEDGLLTLSGKSSSADSISPRAAVLPTITALRTLDYYAAYDDRQLAAELHKLTRD